MAPLKIIFSGSGAFGARSLRSLIHEGHQVLKVFTQPDRPAGRGKKLTPTPISLLATELGLSLSATADINSEPLPLADVMVVIAFGQKIAEHVVNHPRLGSINLHASILPKYRGAAPINWAIINGEKVTGNSIIRLANKMDAGAVLGQSELTIGNAETTGELHDRLAEDGAPLLLNVLQELAAGTETETEQNHALATQAPKLSRETATINWSDHATSVSRKINGLSPWPGCRIRVIDQTGKELARATLLKSQPLQIDATSPGQIQMDGSISAGANAVQILMIQPEGKRPMTLTDYARGNRWIAGLRIESIA